MCAVCFWSMAGNGDIDQSELEDELPGDRSLLLQMRINKTNYGFDHFEFEF